MSNSKAYFLFLFVRSSSSSTFLCFFVEEKMKLLTYFIDSLTSWLIILTNCSDSSRSVKLGNFCVSLFIMVVLCELYAGHCIKKCFSSSTIITLSIQHCLQTLSSIGITVYEGILSQFLGHIHGTQTKS